MNLRSQACTTDYNGRVYNNLTSFLGDFRSDAAAINCTAQLQAIADDIAVLGFCHGSASVPRGFVRSVEIGAAAHESQCDHTAAVVDSGKDSPLLGDVCDSRTHV